MHFRRAKEKEWTPSQPLGPNLKVRVEGTTHIIKPKASMRYLGFYLDPKLTFREHIRFYATKAASTVQALRMLGNSARGLSPTDKRRLYISNVVPVMAYGAQLWWHPSWKGKKWIAQQLQKAQTRGARWITGGFRTSPTGSLEMMAGLMPIKHQIDKFMGKAGLRAKMIHDKHPIRAQFPPKSRPVGEGVYKPPMPLTDVKSKDGETPVAHMAKIANECTEVFNPLHEECRPGSRVVDTYEERVKCHLDDIDGNVAPLKAQEDEMKDWINAHLNPLISRIEDEPSAILVFTDGSQKKANQNGDRPTVKAGAGWLVKHQGRTKKGSFGCGKATPYDAEMAALARGISEATDNPNPEAKAIHVFADNKGALSAIMMAKAGPAQSFSTLACSRVRKWLEEDEERTVHLWWCPGHSGVYFNDMVDREANAGLKKHATRSRLRMQDNSSRPKRTRGGSVT